MGKMYFWRLFPDSGNGKKSIYMRAIRKEGPAVPWGLIGCGVKGQEEKGTIEDEMAGWHH